MIRMSTAQMFNSSLYNMTQTQSRMNNTNNQLGSGKAISTPADDPVAAAQTLNTKTRISVVAQQTRNVDFADKNLSQTESVLNQVEDSLIRLKEMAIQLGSDQWSENQIKSTGTEAKEILNHLQGLVNTKNESGEYIFAGSQADRKAYDGNSFQGDKIEREAQVADSTFMKMLTSGDRAFENLTGLKTKSEPVQVAALDSYDPAAPSSADLGGYISDGQLIKFRNQLEDAKQASEQGPDEFVDWLIAEESGVLSFPPGTTDAVKKDWVDANWNDIRQDMPEPWDDAGLTYNGGTNQFTAFTPAFDGSLVDLESSDIYHNNMLSTVQYFVDSLGVAENAKPNKEGIRASIDNLDIVFEQVSQTRSQIGARQNTLEAVKTSNEDFELFAKKSLSDLEDLDYAEAITRFQQQQMSLQAGQQAFGRVAGLSLFNHI